MRTMKIIKINSCTIFILLTISFGFSSYADQSFFLKPTENTIKAEVSRAEITRISFLSDIESIHALKGEIEYEIADKDLYLRANVDKQVNFFVKTTAGKTYKFIASPENIPAQQIFIRAQASSTKLKLPCKSIHKVKEQ